MNSFSTEYRTLSNDELLQLWAERSGLVHEARIALRHEIQDRHLASEAEFARDVWAEVELPARAFSSPVNTYFNASVLWFAIRELWLRNRTRSGVSHTARVESTLHSRPGYRSASRVELRYSYLFKSKHYKGRTVRDFMFNHRAADALAFAHRVGKTIAIRIDPSHPERSYFPSGFGWIEPLLVGSIGLLLWAIVIAFLVAAVIPK